MELILHSHNGKALASGPDPIKPFSNTVKPKALQQNRAYALLSEWLHRHISFREPKQWWRTQGGKIKFFNN